MPRPLKRRRICAEPSCGRFGPMEGAYVQRPMVTMALDEFESIRLIDLEGLTQEECARADERRPHNRSGGLCQRAGEGGRMPCQ